MSTIESSRLKSILEQIYTTICEEYGDSKDVDRVNSVGDDVNYVWKDRHLSRLKHEEHRRPVAELFLNYSYGCMSVCRHGQDLTVRGIDPADVYIALWINRTTDTIFVETGAPFALGVNNVRTEAMLRVIHLAEELLQKK